MLLLPPPPSSNPPPIDENSPSTNVAISSEPVPTQIDCAELEVELSKIPRRLQFKIGEVAEMAGVKAHVLRYWETEFEALRPKKSAHNQRVYSYSDVQLILMIRQLVYRDKFSLQGAKSALKKLKSELKERTQKNQHFVEEIDSLQKTLAAAERRKRDTAQALQSLVNEISLSRERLKLKR